MRIKKQNLHRELKTALMLKGLNLSRFAKGLIRPNGETGISHTALIRVAQHHENTPWILAAIKEEIRNSKSNFPEYWKEMGDR